MENGVKNPPDKYSPEGEPYYISDIFPDYEKKMAQEALWEILRDKGLMGLEFTRDVQCYGFGIDFLCQEKGLGIEIAGPSQDYYVTIHAHLLGDCGIDVVCLSSDVIMNNPNHAIAEIMDAIRMKDINIG